MLRTSGLEYAYGQGPRMRFADFSLAKGDHCLLLGDSGSGKTTLLHLLGGLLAPQAGHIYLEDTDLATLSAAALDRFRGQYIGIVFQKSHFIRALTLEENLLLAQRLAGASPDRARVYTLLERLQLGHKLRAKPSALSMGEQQRAAIARAIINQPRLILADEPTSALDDGNCAAVAALLQEQAQTVAATLLIVTHDNRLKDLFPQQIELALL